MEIFDPWEYFVTTDIPRIAYWVTMLLMPAGIGVSVICLAQLGNYELPKRHKQMFRLLFISEITYLLMHFLREVFEEFRWRALTVLLPAVTFIEFFAPAFIVLFISLYLIEAAAPEKLKKPFIGFLCGMTGLHIVLLMIAQFNKMYYSFPVLELGDGLIYIQSISSLPGATAI